MTTTKVVRVLVPANNVVAVVIAVVLVLEAVVVVW